MSRASTSPSIDSIPQFRCEQPGCTRSFRRKEHLNRHAKSHDATVRYQCHICGSSYARSDVLRRHVQNHPRNERVKRTLVACTECRERKLRCDDNSPCLPCERGGLTCTRNGSDIPVTFTESHNTGSTVAASPVTSFNDLNSSAHLETGLAQPSEQVEPLNANSDVHEQPRRLTSLDKVSPEMTRLVAIYFTDVHPVWPILHQATFEQSPCAPALLMAMGALSSQFEGSNLHNKLSSVLFSTVLSSLLPVEIHLQDLQAGLLTLIYYLHFSTSKRSLEKASHLNLALIATYRSQGVFSAQFQDTNENNDPFRAWVFQEELKRLAFFALRTDAYLSILSGDPPTIRYSELGHLLLKSESLWSASTDEERQRLEWNEPVARERILYADLAYDANNLPRHPGLQYKLSDEDYHMLLCCIQNEVWNANHVRKTTQHQYQGSVIQPVRTSQFSLCCSQLDQWMKMVEEQSHLSQRYFSGTTEMANSIILPLNLLVWHILSLQVHYPSSHTGRSDRSTRATFLCSPMTTDTEARHRLDSIGARKAVWSGLQITQIHLQELSFSSPYLLAARYKLIPFHITALCRAALVVCTYIKTVKNCFACTGEDFGRSTDLLKAPYGCGGLGKWQEDGNIHAQITCNSTEMSFCSCNFEAIATWYQQLLAVDEHGSDAFRTFLEVL